MKKILIGLTALATLAMAVPSIASAQDRPMMRHGMHRHHHMMKPMMMHRHHHRMHMKRMMRREGM
jgi:hypothetical protein